MRRPGSDLLSWGIPLALVLHNLEEGLTFARYLPRVRQILPELVAVAIPDALTLYAALIVATAVPIALGVLSRRARSAEWATFALLLVTAIVLVNVGWHVTAAFVLHGYAPGVATAVTINLPLTVVVLRQAVRSGLLSSKRLSAMLLFAVLLHGPIPLAIIGLMRLLA